MGVKAQPHAQLPCHGVNAATGLKLTPPRPHPRSSSRDNDGDDIYYSPGMEYDPMFALRGELVASCTDALMYHAMFEGYNGPGRKAWSWQDFNKDLCGNDFFDNGATL